MRKGVLLAVGLFLMVFMIGSVSAEEYCDGIYNPITDKCDVDPDCVSNFFQCCFGMGWYQVSCQNSSFVLPTLYNLLRREKLETNDTLNSFEQRISRIEDDLFDSPEGMTKVYVYDIWGCEVEGFSVDEINKSFNEWRTKTKLKYLEHQRCVIFSIVDDIKNNIIFAIQDAITGHATRIDALESSSGSGNGGEISNVSFPNYFKYLSSTDRKNVICDYAKDNHLDTYSDLGWGCVVTYKQSSRGETASCRCKETPDGSAAIIPPFYLNDWKAATTGITLEITNLGGEDYTLKSLAITDCGTLDLRNKKISVGSYQSIRVPCRLTRGNQFNGDITLSYNKVGTVVDLTSTGQISEIVA
ncbi:MAG: hypothetical protein KKE50_04300 [Nanoarchaeota archaeon]|nr:hypothetical protein [Nanoarchaeota archaeon]